MADARARAGGERTRTRTRKKGARAETVARVGPSPPPRTRDEREGAPPPGRHRGRPPGSVCSSPSASATSARPSASPPPRRPRENRERPRRGAPRGPARARRRRRRRRRRRLRSRRPQRPSGGRRRGCTRASRSAAPGAETPANRRRPDAGDDASGLSTRPPSPRRSARPRCGASRGRGRTWGAVCARAPSSSGPWAPWEATRARTSAGGCARRGRTSRRFARDRAWRTPPRVPRACSRASPGSETP